MNPLLIRLVRSKIQAMIGVPFAFVMYATQTQSKDGIIPDWVPAIIAELRSDGILVGYPPVLHPSKSRFEFAVGINAAYANTSNMIFGMESGSPPSKQSIDYFIAKQNRWPKMIRVVDEFSEELKVLGLDPARIEIEIAGFQPRIGELWFKYNAPDLGYPSFLDVPKDHWAAKAVSHLKAVGVLNGLPNGKFD